MVGLDEFDRPSENGGAEILQARRAAATLPVPKLSAMPVDMSASTPMRTAPPEIAGASFGA